MSIDPLTRCVGAVLLLVAPISSAWAACDCTGHPFKAARTGILGRDATVLRGALVNDERGRLKIGARAFMPATTNVTAHYVQAGPEASIGSVNANLVRFHSTSVVAGPVVGPLTLPVESPFCTLAPIDCGSDSLVVSADQGSLELSPGSYGTIKIGRGALARLLPGTYDVCDFKLAHTGALIAEGAVTINVKRTFRAAAETIVVPDTGQPRITFNVEGPRVLFGNGSVVRAEVTAPNARLKLGQLSAFEGCFCARDAKVGPYAGLNCN